MAEEKIEGTDAGAGAEGGEGAGAPAKTVAEIQAGAEGEGAGEGEGKKPAHEPRLVPESALINEKNGRKDAEKEVARLKKLIEGGASASEVSSDIDSIADEYGVDKDFLKKFANTIRNEAKAEVEDKLTAKEKAEQKAKDIDTAFTKEFSRTMANMPEFADIVNENVVKTLTLLPANSNKTFKEIIEETYGKSLTGKRTIEPTKAGGGKDPEPLDFNKARKDSAYFAEVMSNPALKKAYNAKMLEKGF